MVTIKLETFLHILETMFSQPKAMMFSQPKAIKRKLILAFRHSTLGLIGKSRTLSSPNPRKSPVVERRKANHRNPCHDGQGVSATRPPRLSLPHQQFVTL